ncbi:MAG: class F sortase [Chloroflexota bacterium]|nr:class F sortase [Chloroflexota bacterium]
MTLRLRLTRRQVMIAAGGSLATILARAHTLVLAQDDATPAPVAVGTPAAGSGLIKPTGLGAVPSTGASRPGPVNQVRSRAVSPVISPVGLTIESAGVDAGIEPLRVVDGAMQDPSGPWEVAWYENLGSLGAPGNVVMAGHIDYWNVGPSVFYNLGSVQPGAEIIVAGDDGLQYPFTVEWIELFTSDDMPMDEITGPTDTQSLTLITCGGAFDYVNGQYLQRTVVRATRSGPGIPVA